MLNLKPTNMFEEIESAERYRDSHFEHYKDVIQGYVGPMHSSIGSDEFSPENHVYEYLSLTVPRLINDNPRVRVSTRRPVTYGAMASALEHGLNRWARDTNVRDVMRRVAFDTLITYGVMMTAQMPMGGHDPTSKFKAYWPNCYRISPKRFIIDPLALSVSESRYQGHMWVRDREDLIEEAKVDSSWNPEVIERIAGVTDLKERKLDHQSSRDTPERNEVTAYDIWVPEVQLDESPGPEFGFHGTIYTIAVGISHGERDPEKADYIRDPRPFYGPPTGPYTMFGCYYVPDTPYPLSPIMATMGQVNELNDHVRSASMSAAKYKRLILVDGKNKKLVQDVKSQPHDYVVPVEGLDRDAVIQMELGGITNQQVSYIQMARERLDRNSGIHDAMRGNVTGSATATEVSIADSSTTIRLAYIKQQFLEATRNIMEKVGWYLHNDDRVAFPLGADAAKEMGMGEPYFVGGMNPPQSYDDIELEIDPYSMERTTEALQQRRAMEAFQIIANVASAMPTMPYVNWNALLDKMGDALNMPDLSTLVDSEMLQQMIQQQQEQAQMEQISAQTAPQEMSSEQAAAQGMGM
tara:strand:- start:811 stop:2550 length:1740 start_codon:yes stop_codon:yes gene_type:complete